MKYLLGAILASIFWIVLLSSVPMPETEIRIYDCGMAEWHPDIPKDVKEECRKRYRQRGPNT